MKSVNKTALHKNITRMEMEHILIHHSILDQFLVATGSMLLHYENPVKYIKICEYNKIKCVKVYGLLMDL